jgi:hypothetical protein
MPACLQVVAPHEGSPLTFATIEEFSVGIFKSMLGPDASSDVRQVRMDGLIELTVIHPRELLRTQHVLTNALP